MNTTRNSIRNLIMATSLLLGASLAGAAITNVWSGAVNSDWSNPGNWTNGMAPTSTGLDSVWLEPGINPPSNQDITGLYINTLTFSTNTAGFTLNGSDIKLKQIDTYDNTAAYVTNTVNCGIIVAANNSWTWKASTSSKCFLRLNGTLGESGVVARIPSLNYGNLILAGSNTFSGGLDNNTGIVRFYTDQNLGAMPATYVTNYFRGDFGVWRALNTGLFNRVTIHANRGLKGGSSLAADLNAKIVLNSPVAGTSLNCGGTHVGSSSRGRILLAGDGSSFTGWVQVQSGTLVLMHSNALGTVASQVGKQATFVGGTLDVHGHAVGFYFPSIWNNPGYDSLGAIMNSDITIPAVLSGDIRLTYAADGSAIALGGRGDITVTGAILSSNNSMMTKSGNGVVTFKGANVYTNYTSVRLGGLTVDYTDNNSKKLGTNALYLSQARFRMVGSAGAPSTETVASIGICTDPTYLPWGASSITLEPGLDQNLTLNAGGVAIRGGATPSALDIRVVANGSGTVTMTTTNADGSLAGGAATWNQSTWAKIAGGVVSGMADGEYATSFAGSTQQTDMDLPAGTTTLGATSSAKTLRFNSAAGSTLNIPGSYYLRLSYINGPHQTNNSGILMTANAGPVTITGGGHIRNNWSGSLYIHQYSANPLTLDVPITESTGGTALLKCGPGELIITRTNSHALTCIMGGTLTASNIENAATACGIGTGTDVYLANATLKYIGPAKAHNHVIKLRGPGTLDASGSGLLEFTATTAVSSYTPAGTDNSLTLAGTGAGQINGLLDLHSGDVIKTGVGSWTIGGVQTNYWGDTIVSNGTLRLSNNCVLVRNVRVESGGILAGSGTILEDLVMNGTRRVEIRGDADYDTLGVGFDTTLGGTLQIAEMNGYKMPANLNLSIVNSGGTLSGAFANVTGGAFQIKTSADGKQILLSKRYPGFIFYVQ